MARGYGRRPEVEVSGPLRVARGGVETSQRDLRGGPLAADRQCQAGQLLLDVL